MAKRIYRFRLEIGGNCPVQGDGNIEVWRGPCAALYFRARGQGYYVMIDETEIANGSWGDNQHAAGWMPIPVALRLIADALERYEEGGNGR